MKDKGCDNCYYKYFISDAYPCSRCVRNAPSEDMWKPWASKTENGSEKPNNYEPKICDTCRYYNGYIPCGSTPSACKKADKFAKEFVDGLKKLQIKVEPQMGDAKPIPLSSRITQTEREGE